MGRLTRLLQRALPMAALLIVAAAPDPQHGRASSGSASDPRPSPNTIEAWRNRKFGMFIHFGLYSMAGGMWNGRRIDNGYSEQILANGKLPPAAYAALARRFDPRKFDPDAIVALAKAAGMKYIVITAKHHDGFNLFATKTTSYNVVDATPYHRDIVGAMATACRRGGIAFGVYYSTIDWHHPGGNRYIPGNSNPITPAQEAFNVAQLKELLSNYGPISELWFDMGRPTPAQSAHFARTVHALQPETMVSGRVWNHQGDFTVMGDNGEPNVAVEEPWESPASIYPETWGYRSWQVRTDLSGKIREHIGRLVRVVSAGGNYILNIGPTGDGAVVPFEGAVLKGIGAWLTVHGEAIYGTRAQPFPKLDFGYATLGDHRLYLFVERMPADGRLRLPGIVDTHFGTASVLGQSRGNGVAVTTDTRGALIDTKGLPGLAQENFMPVVVIPVIGDLHVRPPSVAPDRDKQAHLTPANGDRFLRHDGFGYDAPAKIYKMRWDVALGPGTYALTLRYRPPAHAARVGLVVDGHAQILSLNRQGRSRAVVRRDTGRAPYALRLEINPAPPRSRADHLPVSLLGADIAPHDGLPSGKSGYRR